MLSPSLLWLIAGAILCFMEAVFPVGFVVFLMGISAMLVGAISLVIASFSLQVTIWLSFYTLFVASSQLLLPKQKILAFNLGDDDQRKTLT